MNKKQLAPNQDLGYDNALQKITINSKAIVNHHTIKNKNSSGSRVHFINLNSNARTGDTFSDNHNSESKTQKSILEKTPENTFKSPEKDNSFRKSLQFSEKKRNSLEKNEVMIAKLDGKSLVREGKVCNKKTNPSLKVFEMNPKNLLNSHQEPVRKDYQIHSISKRYKMSIQKYSKPKESGFKNRDIFKHKRRSLHDLSPDKLQNRFDKQKDDSMHGSKRNSDLDIIKSKTNNRSSVRTLSMPAEKAEGNKCILNLFLNKEGTKRQKTTRPSTNIFKGRSPSVKKQEIIQPKYEYVPSLSKRISSQDYYQMEEENLEMLDKGLKSSNGVTSYFGIDVNSLGVRPGTQITIRPKENMRKSKKISKQKDEGKRQSDSPTNNRIHNQPGIPGSNQVIDSSNNDLFLTSRRLEPNDMRIQTIKLRNNSPNRTSKTLLLRINNSDLNNKNKKKNEVDENKGEFPEDPTYAFNENEFAKATIEYSKDNGGPKNNDLDKDSDQKYSYEETKVLNSIQNNFEKKMGGFLTKPDESRVIKNSFMSREDSEQQEPDIFQESGDLGNNRKVQIREDSLNINISGQTGRKSDIHKIKQYIAESKEKAGLSNVKTKNLTKRIKKNLGPKLTKKLLYNEEYVQILKSRAVIRKHTRIHTDKGTVQKKVNFKTPDFYSNKKFPGRTLKSQTRPGTQVFQRRDLNIYGSNTNRVLNFKNNNLVKTSKECFSNRLMQKYFTSVMNSRRATGVELYNDLFPDKFESINPTKSSNFQLTTENNQKFYKRGVRKNIEFNQDLDFQRDDSSEKDIPRLEIKTKEEPEMPLKVVGKVIDRKYSPTTGKSAHFCRATAKWKQELDKFIPKKNEL
ncbi:unnamed protein product [Moneuplotes crassus]|uniref:Uncharacterized protein n=1 Tax=Euplotes crassus TaxID=5936 RepID=A0AAD1X4K6_EUPCR|nr:unnamed protein product [Moneuplotes crassus]